MAFNTGNPLGSSDFKDLSDNAVTFDKYANGTEPTYVDRFGELRRSIAGQNEEFDNAQDGRQTAFDNATDDQEARFQQFLLSSGYQPIGNYAAGLVIDARNKIFFYQSQYWRVAGSTAIPYTTTGVWASEQANFVALGDGTLRDDLNASTGATLVRHGAVTVAAELDAQAVTNASVAQQLAAGGFKIKIFDHFPVTGEVPLYTPYMVVLPPDVTKPIVDTFAVTSGYSPLTITSFTAHDDRAVTGYWIGETAGVPALSDPKWTESAPATYTTTTQGTFTLYARARDAAGNISDAKSAAVTVPVEAFTNAYWPSTVPGPGITVRKGSTPNYVSALAFVWPETGSYKAFDAFVASKKPTYAGTGALRLTVRTGSPTGTVLSTMSIPDFNGGLDVFVQKRWTAPSNITLTAGTTYYFVFDIPSPSGDTFYGLPYDSSSGTYWYSENGGAFASGTGRSPLRALKV